jgi:putative transposase
MSRPLRIEYPGALYHVTSRGNARADIYLYDQDRQAFLDVLSEAVERFGWWCHGYCLMDNHYHLLIETPMANLGRGMRHLNGVYSQCFNRAHGRVGHVFQGRYKAILVERQTYLLELARYIVLNPVRAHMTDQAEGWTWSSYRATAGLATVPNFLETNWILQQFGARPDSALKHYRRFVGEGMRRSSPWDDLIGGTVLGSEAFVIEAQKISGDAQAETPNRLRHVGRPSLESLRQDAKMRGEWMAQAFGAYGYTLSEIAAMEGLHYSRVSRIIKRWKDHGGSVAK